MRANDVISGLVIIAFALAMVAYTATFPAFPGQQYGPALFPRILGAGLILCGALLVRNGLVAHRAGEPWIIWADWTEQPWRVTSFALVLALLIFYILVSETVGFILVGIVFLGALLWWLGVRPLTAAIIAIVTTLAIQWFFGTAMRVPLPRGWLTDYM